MNPVTIKGMENYTYNRNTRTLYRGNKLVKPINGEYLMKCGAVTCTKTVEQIHELTKINHKPLSPLRSVYSRFIDKVALAHDKAKGMTHNNLMAKYECSARTVKAC